MKITEEHLDYLFDAGEITVGQYLDIKACENKEERSQKLREAVRYNMNNLLASTITTLDLAYLLMEGGDIKLHEYMQIRVEKTETKRLEKLQSLMSNE